MDSTEDLLDLAHLSDDLTLLNFDFPLSYSTAKPCTPSSPPNSPLNPTSLSKQACSSPTLPSLPWSIKDSSQTLSNLFPSESFILNHSSLKSNQVETWRDGGDWERKGIESSSSSTSVLSSLSSSPNHLSEEAKFNRRDTLALLDILKGRV